MFGKPFGAVWGPHWWTNPALRILWRICFAPASGNVLAPAALNRFMAAAGEDAPEPMRILFSPEGAGAADDYTLKQLSDTTEKWENMK